MTLLPKLLKSANKSKPFLSATGVRKSVIFMLRVIKFPVFTLRLLFTLL